MAFFVTVVINPQQASLYLKVSSNFVIQYLLLIFPILSVITLLMKNIGLALRGGPILFITRMITDRIVNCTQWFTHEGENGSVLRFNRSSISQNSGTGHINVRGEGYIWKNQGMIFDIKQL